MQDHFSQINDDFIEIVICFLVVKDLLQINKLGHQQGLFIETAFFKLELQYSHNFSLFSFEVISSQLAMCYFLFECPQPQRIDLFIFTSYPHSHHSCQMQFRYFQLPSTFTEVLVQNEDGAEEGLFTALVGTQYFYHPIYHFGSESASDFMFVQEVVVLVVLHFVSSGSQIRIDVIAIGLAQLLSLHISLHHQIIRFRLLDAHGLQSMSRMFLQLSFLFSWSPLLVLVIVFFVLGVDNHQRVSRALFATYFRPGAWDFHLLLVDLLDTFVVVVLHYFTLYLFVTHQVHQFSLHAHRVALSVNFSHLIS